MQLQEANVLKSLLSGHEVQLDEGAFGNRSRQILRLFTEAKRTHSEQLQDLENIPIVSTIKVSQIETIIDIQFTFYSIDFTRSD